MQTVPYTKALEVLLEGGTIRRVLPAGHSPILYIAPLRGEWQPAIPGLTERGRVWIGEVHASHDAAKRDGSRSYTVSDGDRAGQWEILCERGYLPGRPEDWIINRFETYEQWQARNNAALLLVKES